MGDIRISVSLCRDKLQAPHGWRVSEYRQRTPRQVRATVHLVSDFGKTKYFVADLDRDLSPSFPIARLGVSQVARGDILEYFNRIFDGLCKLFSDSDVDVRNGSNLLDRLIKVRRPPSVVIRYTGATVELFGANNDNRSKRSKTICN